MGRGVEFSYTHEILHGVTSAAVNEAYTDKSEPLLTRSRTYLMILQQNENFSGKHGENRTIELFTQGVHPDPEPNVNVHVWEQVAS